ncbi:unnamed protein product [Camellia sinensis]
MANGRLGQWLQMLVCVLILLKTEGFYVRITYVQNAVAKGAVCLDGSPPAYHLDKGFEAGINNWLVHFEGGGWCNNVATCLARKNTRLGSSKQMANQLAFFGLLSNLQKFNPDFYNWNRIKVMYCDGSSFTGDVEAVNPATNLHFRGARIFAAVIDDLLEKGMKNAANAIISGGSAGGLTSILHCDSFRALLPIGTKVKCLSDAGYFINTKDVSRTQHIEAFYNDVVTTHGKGIKLRGFSTRTTTYTTPLNPPAISFETKEGGAMLSEAMAEGTAEGSLKLLANYGMQRDLNFCGPASLCTVLNALRVDPKRAWKGPWRWFEDHMIGDSEIMGNIRKKGITFDNFAELARKHVDIEAFKAQQSSLEQFTDSVIETTSVEDLHMILSYSRKKVNQTGDGHFSPMAAYHKGSDMLLILDVARYKYPFHWLPRMTVWDAMNQIDKETGETRGFLMVRKKSHEPELWRD